MCAIETLASSSGVAAHEREGDRGKLDSVRRKKKKKKETQETPECAAGSQFREEGGRLSPDSQKEGFFSLKYRTSLVLTCYNA